ncbi:ATP-dependent nuclease [Sphingomonas sp. PWP1-2]|uniref:ATP-dependent nuclease n=1 Tax=Sphingomonas sp. PWP1-2 TaxID=2804558 RepID=UPI003CFB7B3B
MQIGQQDSSQQIESHNSQPHLKYSRLKNTIFSTIISGDDGRRLIEWTFEEIFSGVLKGRKLAGIGINEYGLMSVRIQDQVTGRIFDIDNLSSGEKGLVLTFLMISRTLSDNSIVLLDEPELHLNPAVCKNMLSFMVDTYVNPSNIQMIICSHSPEILAGAFERDECTLFHLISDSMITKVRRSDHEEIAEALRKVGTSESEALLYKGTVFVEGPHDVELLEAGFPGLLRQYRVKDLGGRNEIEKQIRLLLDAEKEGNLTTNLFFIFDKDCKQTSWSSTDHVGVLQWTKYCFENYLIDLDALTDILKDPSVTSRPVSNQGALLSIIKPLAMAHLNEQIVRDVFEDLRPSSIHAPDSSVANLPFEEAASSSFDKIESVKTELSVTDRSMWTRDFVKRCQAEMSARSALWDTEWKNLCDGKRLYREIQIEFGIKTSPLNLKRKVLTSMASDKSGEHWQLIETQLKTLLRV